MGQHDSAVVVGKWRRLLYVCACLSSSSRVVSCCWAHTCVLFGAWQDLGRSGFAIAIQHCCVFDSQCNKVGGLVLEREGKDQKEDEGAAAAFRNRATS
jgi:hypothetical protein